MAADVDDRPVPPVFAGLGGDGAEAQHPVGRLAHQDSQHSSTRRRLFVHRRKVGDAALQLDVLPRQQGPRVVQHQRIPGLNHEAGKGGQVSPIGLAKGGGLPRCEKVLLAPGRVLPLQPHDASVPPAEPAAQIDVPGVPGSPQVGHPAARPEGEVRHGGSQGFGHSQATALRVGQDRSHHRDFRFPAGKADRGRSRRTALDGSQDRLDPEMPAVVAVHGPQPVVVPPGPLRPPQPDERVLAGGVDGIGQDLDFQAAPLSQRDGISV